MRSTVVLLAIIGVLWSGVALAHEHHREAGAELNRENVYVYVQAWRSASGGTWSPPEGFWVAHIFEGGTGGCPDGQEWWRDYLMRGDRPARGYTQGDDLHVPAGSGTILVGSAGGIELLPGPYEGEVTSPRCGPPPITPEEVWSALAEGRIPAPRVSLDPPPAFGGLTGLETRASAEGGTELAVEASVEGYGVRAEVRAISYLWEMGDGTRYRTDHPGSPEHPAVRHVYETKGDYLLTLAVEWTGTYRFTTPTGTTHGPYPLGSELFTEEVPYRVVEVRSVPVP